MNSPYKILSKKAIESHSSRKYSANKCRVCLKDGTIAIFGGNDISKQLKEFGQIEVSINDNLPQSICDACHSLLEAAIMFRKTAKRTDHMLRNPSPSDSEDSDNTHENETTSKREYLELCFSSDSEMLVDSIDDDMCDNIKTEVKSEDESIPNASMSAANPTTVDIKEETNLSVSDNEDDYETEWLDIKEESLDDYDADNEMMLIIVSDKDKQSPTHSNCDKSNNTIQSIDELKSSKSTAPSITDTLGYKKCEICRTYIRLCDINAHMKGHREKYKEQYDKKHAKVECGQCGKKVGRGYYKHHLKMHETPEKNRIVKCSVCEKSVSSQYLPEHMKRMHDKNVHPEKPKNVEPDNLEEMLTFKQCPICDKAVIENEYKLHLAKHGGGGPIKNYICDQCGKVCKSPSAFKTHCLTHTSELKYKCQFCPYRGLHQGLLKIHVRTHTGDYNYKCTECPAKFITKSNLSKHLMRHKGICNYKCEVCDKGFYTKRDVDRHVINAHKGVKDNICGVCGKAFAHRDNMLSHQLKVHKREAISRGRLPTYLKAKQKQDNQ